MNKNVKVRKTFTLSKDLVEWLDRKSKTIDRSKSWLVNKGLEKVKESEAIKSK